MVMVLQAAGTVDVGLCVLRCVVVRGGGGESGGRRVGLGGLADGAAFSGFGSGFGKVEREFGLGGGLLRGFELDDFVAEAGGVFVALGLHGFAEVGFEFGEAFVERFAREGANRNLARVGGAFVHVVQHGGDNVLEGGVALRAAKASVLFEIGLGETAGFATERRGGGGGGDFGQEGGFAEEIGKGEALGSVTPLACAQASQRSTLCTLLLRIWVRCTVAGLPQRSH